VRAKTDGLSVLVETTHPSREDARIYAKGIHSLGLCIGEERFYECKVTTKRVR
jgi:hypothetical protein